MIKNNDRNVDILDYYAVFLLKNHQQPILFHQINQHHALNALCLTSTAINKITLETSYG